MARREGLRVRIKRVLLSAEEPILTRQKEVMGMSLVDCKSGLVGWEVANTSKKGFTEVLGGDGDKGSASRSGMS